MVGLHDPAHFTLLGRGIPNLLSYVEGRQYPITKKCWTTINYRPVDTDDLDFFRGTQPLSSDAAVQAWYMGFLIVSFDATGASTQSFEYEIVANIEMQGNVVLNKVPSHVDPVGHGAVNAISAQAKSLHSPHQEEGQHLQSAMVSASDHYAASMMTGSKQTNLPSAHHQSLWADVLQYAPAVISGIMSLF